MNETYVATKANDIRYLGNGLKIKEFIDLGYDIYIENLSDNVREVVYDQKTAKFYKEVSVTYIDGTVKILATPEKGWIGL